MYRLLADIRESAGVEGADRAWQVYRPQHIHKQEHSIHIYSFGDRDVAGGDCGQFRRHRKRGQLLAKDSIKITIGLHHLLGQFCAAQLDSTPGCTLLPRFLFQGQ